MNILIPHTWLLEHLQTQATPEEIQKYLSLCGPSVERIYQREGEVVYDIEVTTNRVDSMSVRGIAREAAVILPQFGVKATLKPLKLPEFASNFHIDQLLPQPTVINDPALCKRVMYVILKDVLRTPTPEWMAKRLIQTEMNVHDSVIDITNYITHELGHPCHAFDYDKIMDKGGQIKVVAVTAGKKFTTLDGEVFTTVGGEVVFENQTGEIIDFPAIKGTANTAITADTKNVLLWIESLDAGKVRFGSMTHAIRTVAAQLNEKNVDPALGEDVLAKGIELYQSLCQAQVASRVHDEFPGQREPQPISVALTYIQTYLGIKMAAQKITQILQILGCEVTLENNQAFLVKPPSFRPDLVIPADIVEEVARIYGYHNLPSNIMDTAIPLLKPEGLHLDLEKHVKHFLANIGWQEVYTYSLVSRELAQASGRPLTEHLQLLNPLTDDKVYLRRSLIPSLEEVISTNPMSPELSVFEIANVYVPQSGDLPDHQMTLGWASNRGYRQVRGDLEVLSRSLFMKGLEIVPVPVPKDVYSSTYETLGKIRATDQKGNSHTLGVIGITKAGLITCEIYIPALAQVTRTHPTYQPLAKTMPIIEDLTFTLAVETAIGPVLKTIQELSPLITTVELKDIYQQNYSFTLTYQDPNQNLEAKTVEVLRKKVVTTLASEYQAQLVGVLQ